MWRVLESRWYCFSYGVKYPQKRILGREYVFQANAHNIKTCVMVKNYEPNPAKFCTVTNVGKYSSLVVQTCYNKSKMADGRHFEKKAKNRHILATAWPIGTKFGKVNAYWPSEPFAHLKNKFLELKMADGRHFVNNEIAIS